MTKLFMRPQSMNDVSTPYCPGCTHGIAHRLVGEAVDELGCFERTIGIVTAGCSVRSWRLYRFDMVLTAHGRPPAVATGLKRALPDRMVFAYQGDGDCAAIGIGELLHAAKAGKDHCLHDQQRCLRCNGRTGSANYTSRPSYNELSARPESKSRGQPNQYCGDDCEHIEGLIRSPGGFEQCSEHIESERGCDPRPQDSGERAWFLFR